MAVLAIDSAQLGSFDAHHRIAKQILQDIQRPSSPALRAVALFSTNENLTPPSTYKAIVEEFIHEQPHGYRRVDAFLTLTVSRMHTVALNSPERHHLTLSS